jgi:hypothetical protein
MIQFYIPWEGEGGLLLFFFNLQSYDFERTVMKVITETRRAH